MSGRARDTDVVIVGGGPVGMLVAAELAGFGIPVVVVESNSKVSERPKATTIHARTVQTLVRRGYLQELTRTEESTCEPFHFAGLPGLRIPVPAREPQPGILKRPQSRLEREFEEYALRRGAVVLRRHRVTDVRQDPGSVTVTAEGPAGPRVLRGRYLVGADGARSTVRTLMNFAEETSEATVAGIVGLARLRRADALPPGLHRTEHGWTYARTGPDGMSLIRTLDCTRAHENRDRPPTVQELSAEAARITGHEVAMTDAVHLTRFSDYTRLVREYRRGRVFLAGDAAHVHFPIGGQGLSTGLLDALNLGWKLAFSLRGTAGRDVLDSYDAERRPAAQRVVDNTRAQLSLMRTEAAVNPLRDLFADLLDVTEVNRRIALLISAQDTAYRNLDAHSSSVWEGTFLKNFRIRASEAGGSAGNTDVATLLQDGQPLLLLRNELSALRDAAGSWDKIVRVVTVHSGLPCEGLLVRPDGHVAWASDGGDLVHTLVHWFGER